MQFRKHKQQPRRLRRAVDAHARGDLGRCEAEPTEGQGRVLEDGVDGGEGEGQEHGVVVDEEDGGDAGVAEELGSCQWGVGGGVFEGRIVEGLGMRVVS